MSALMNRIRSHQILALGVMIALLGLVPAASGQLPPPVPPGPPAPLTPPTTGTAFIATTDFSTGSYSIIDLATQDVFSDIAPNSIHSDALVRYDPVTKRLYVVNRFGGDSVQIIDPLQGYVTPNGAQLSVGNGTNPQDIAVISATKAYISRAESAELLIIDPSTLTELGTIDLSPLIKPGDLDGSPEPFRMLAVGDTVYLTLQHLDRLMTFQPPLAPGEVVVIDTLTDTVTTTIPLAGSNPFSDLQYTVALPQGPRLLVSSVNGFGVLDDGIEAIDPLTNTVDATRVLDEMAVNGDINFFKVLSPTQAYAIVALADGSFTNALIRFNPSTGELVSTLATGLPFTLNFAINNAGHLYISPVDTDDMPPTPGARIFDTALDVEITAAPLNLGNLPGGWVVMVEDPLPTITIQKAGTGMGTVTSFPAGVSCEPTCMANFPVGSAITLTATPDAGSEFTGWDGACTGTGLCRFSLEEDTVLTATFTAVQQPLPLPPPPQN